MGDADHSEQERAGVEHEGAARIDTAIARIEAAIASQAASADALRKRHSALKSRMAEAVKALDDVIARGPG